jgi:hypothetical protein
MIAKRLLLDALNLAARMHLKKLIGAYTVKTRSSYKFPKSIEQPYTEFVRSCLVEVDDKVNVTKTCLKFGQSKRFHFVCVTKLLLLY